MIRRLVLVAVTAAALAGLAAPSSAADGSICVGGSSERGGQFSGVCAWLPV